MRRTVGNIVRSKIPTDDQMVRWTQDIVPAIREVQDHLNSELAGEVDYTTTNTAAFETAWTSDDMPGDGNWRIEVEAQAVSSDGSGGFYWRYANYKRVASGSPAQIGSTRTIGTDNEDVAGWDVQFSTSSNAVVFQVKGDATRIVQWTISYRVKAKIPS